MAGILTKLETVKEALGLKGTSDKNTLLNLIIAQVDELIANEMGRGRVAGNHPISSVASTEYYDGVGREQLLLNRRPVTVITKVAVDAGGYYGKASGAFPAANDWVDGADFAALRLDASESNPGTLISLQKPGKSQITRSGQSGSLGVWPKGRGNILVTYTAGYATIPKDLEMAATLLCSRTYTAMKMGLGGPVNEIRAGDSAFQLLKYGVVGDDLGSARRIIERYAA